MSGSSSRCGDDKGFLVDTDFITEESFRHSCTWVRSRSMWPTQMMQLQHHRSMFRCHVIISGDHTRLVTRQISMWVWPQGTFCVAWSWTPALSIGWPLRGTNLQPHASVSKCTGPWRVSQDVSDTTKQAFYFKCFSFQHHVTQWFFNFYFPFCQNTKERR